MPWVRSSMDTDGFAARRVRDRLELLLNEGQPDPELLDDLEEAVLQAESRILVARHLAQIRASKQAATEARQGELEP